VTGHVPADRDGAFAALHERRPIELALFGGRNLHGAPPGDGPAGVPSRFISQRDVGALVSSGRYSAVVLGTGGRLALPLAWVAARRHRLPFVFWAALWRTPRVAAHLVAVPLMHDIYRNADAVVTYGPHVSEYVKRLGARRVFVAPQAVENEFWAAAAAGRRGTDFAAMFVGRPGREKGLGVLLDAWERSALPSAGATLTVAGEVDRIPSSRSVNAVGRCNPCELRNLYGAADLLVVPSVATRRFLEPWGLVVNEAMNQSCAIVATDAVGAVAGGLVRPERNGLVVPAADAGALAAALRSLAADRARCAALGVAGAVDVSSYTYAAWADGFAAALAGCAASTASLVA
jgi:glycosyltransferase involved in cell wall biosynthesis